MTQSRPNTVIIDYGIGNRGSMRNMIRAAGGSPHVSSSPEDILSAERLILPGVGSFDACMGAFRERGLEAVVHEAVYKCAIPLLAVCVGMQMLFEGSAEGHEKGLGWIAGRVRHLSHAGVADGSKIPNMGWYRVLFSPHEPLSASVPEDSRFYFAHSYYCDCTDPRDIVATIEYGGVTIPAGIRRGSIVAFQLHPEKSHIFGRALINKFLF